MTAIHIKNNINTIDTFLTIFTATEYFYFNKRVFNSNADVKPKLCT